MKEIKLTQGYVALVDDEDYEYLNQWKWYANQRGKYYYARRTLRNEQNKFSWITMHRLIMNPPKGMDVDHINHNTLDNRKCNLRVCTRSQNCRNTTPCGKSKYLGVYFSYYKDKSYIHSDILINGKKKHLGSFKTEEDAALAYNKTALELYGEYANLNIINQ